jgi:flagellar biogenesis protein FliO
MRSLVFALGVWTAVPGPVRAEDSGRAPASVVPAHPIEKPDRAWGSTHQPGGAWWFSLLLIGGALAAFGAFTWAGRRAGTRGPLCRDIQVLGRMPLGPRHAIYTVRVGARTLLVGTGAQGPPALLTELDDWLDEPIDSVRAASATRPVDRTAAAKSVGATPRIMTPTGGG